MMFQYPLRRVTAAFATGLFVGSLTAPGPAGAGTQEPPRVDIPPRLVQSLRDAVSTDLVLRSIEAQNARNTALGETEIARLDDQWRREREMEDKPLISVTLSNPLSTYLTRVQSNSLGLYTAIFVMDRLGLNVAQSIPTSDFWQGDEAKFLKTFPMNAETAFVDRPEYLDDVGIWIAQVSFPIRDPSGAAIGAVTFDLNLTELKRRRAALAEL